MPPLTGFSVCLSVATGSERAFAHHLVFYRVLSNAARSAVVFCGRSGNLVLDQSTTVFASYFVIIRLGVLLGVCSAGDMTNVTQAFHPSGRLWLANSMRPSRFAGVVICCTRSSASDALTICICIAETGPAPLLSGSHP